MAEFIRFTKGGKPSCFEFPEQDDFLKSAEPHFVRAESEISLWKTDGNEFVIAGFIVMGSEPKRAVSYLLIDERVFQEIQIEILHLPSKTAFNCIAGRHYGIRNEKLAVVNLLVRLQHHLKNKDMLVSFEVKEKKEIKPFIIEKKNKCSSFEKDKLKEWVEDFLTELPA